MHLFHKTALAGASLSLGASAFAAPVVIQNGYVKAGVSDYGTLGSNSNNPPGILFDATGTGNYGVNDFLTPGTPFEGFYIQSSAGTSSANNTGSTDFTGSAPTSTSATSASWTGTSSLYGITNTYSLATVGGRSAIAIHTVLSNLSGVDITGLQFLRTLDPDPDVNAFGSYYTVNSVPDSSTACGTGTSSGQTICITTSSSYSHLAGVSRDWSSDPAVYLAGVNDGNGDYAIGLAFDFGTLAAGGSIAFDYAYAAGATIGDVTAVPEPGNIALLLAGLGALGIVRRRRA